MKVLLLIVMVILVSASISQAQSRQLLLSWKDNSTNESGFKIERMAGTAGSWGEIDEVSTNIKTYTDTTPDALQYCYRVLAFNASGLSGPSNVACDPTVPDGDPNNLNLRRLP